MTQYTAEMIEEVSSKKRTEKYWEGYREKFGKDPEVRRHPDTIVGFLSKEKLHEMFMKCDPETLLIGCGLVFHENDDIAFFSDDTLFGYRVLPKDLNGSCMISGIHRSYGPGAEFPDVDAIITRHFKGKRFINSMEELVEYLNDTQRHPGDEGRYY